MRFDANGWLDDAIEVDILENTFDRQGVQPKYIVLHGTAGGSSAEAVANYMKSTVGGSSPVSTHFVIGQDGHIVQCVPLSLAAWGNGILTAGHTSYLPENVNPNLLTLASIEFVKASTDNSDALTPEQETSGFSLIACICDTYDIPKMAGGADGGIIRHADIDPVNRSRCPGTFSYGKLWNYLSNGGNTTMIDLSNPTVASHFSGTDNTMWKCTNGFVIGHAILDFYRKFGGDGLCGLTYAGLPTSLELPIHGYPGVVQQEFERCTLQYDPNHVCDNPPGSGPVYVVHTNQDLRTIALQDEITTLQQLPAAKNLLQINTLAAQIVKLSAVQ